MVFLNGSNEDEDEAKQSQYTIDLADLGDEDEATQPQNQTTDEDEATCVE